MRPPEKHVRGNAYWPCCIRKRFLLSDSSDEEDNVDNTGVSRQKIMRKDERG